MKRIISLLLLALTLAACTATPKPSAEETLHSFFTALANGDYEAAVNLYGGSYEELRQMNPDLAPTDYFKLWKHGCEFNGFVCMEVMDIVRTDESDSQTEFGVTFKTKDGELFQFTGCCGETLPEAITEYVILVQKDANGNYKVHSLPPYVP